jgi:hypothetical protein
MENQKGGFVRFSKGVVVVGSAPLPLLDDALAAPRNQAPSVLLSSHSRCCQCNYNSLDSSFAVFPLSTAPRRPPTPLVVVPVEADGPSRRAPIPSDKGQDPRPYFFRVGGCPVRSPTTTLPPPVVQACPQRGRAFCCADARSSPRRQALCHKMSNTRPPHTISSSSASSILWDPLGSDRPRLASLSSLAPSLLATALASNMVR